MANLLYNGVSLPPLPQRNEEIYPCAYIMGAATINRLLLTSVPLSHDSGLTSNGVVVSFIEYQYDADTNTWVLYKEATEAISYGYRIWWSNTDIYDSTGTLYLAATDPIPVGKPITDPLSFMMGYNLGCRLRAQRGAEKWETLFEGELDTDNATKLKGYVFTKLHKTDDSTNTLKAGNTVRLIVDGNTTMYTAETDSSGNIINIGNIWLTYFSSTSDTDDDGTDYCIREYDGSLQFAVRNAGVYQVKIERAVI